MTQTSTVTTRWKRQCTECHQVIQPGEKAQALVTAHKATYRHEECAILGTRSEDTDVFGRKR